VTAASAAIIVDAKVTNVVVVDVDAQSKIIGWAPPEGDAIVLPTGSPAAIGWDYINNVFYSPLPQRNAVMQGGTTSLPYNITGDLPSGVSFENNILSATAEATLGDFTVTLSDPATNRSTQCVISVVAPPPAS
jgi:hypothetical protein